MNAIDSLFEQHRVVVMAGGSGLYIDAVCHGIDDFPDTDPEIRHHVKEVLESDGIGRIREWLHELDPEYYDEVDLDNPNRMCRAIEVCLQTGTTFSTQRTRVVKKRPFEIIKVGLQLPREVLNEKIDKRVDSMIASGLIEEAKGLYSKRSLNALNTVGYKELFEYIGDRVSLEEAITNIKSDDLVQKG